jgi:hypothetical protein
VGNGEGCWEVLGRAVLVSLDHDLYAPGGEDVGDGLEVARFLAGQAVRCPVVIHSSNAERSERMRGVLEVEGWEVRMVVPVGARGWRSIGRRWCGGWFRESELESRWRRTV